MLEYDPCTPNLFYERNASLKASEPMRITPAVLLIASGEEAYRRRLDITRRLDPRSPAALEAEQDDAKERSVVRVVRGTDRSNIGAKLLAKMGFSGKGGIGSEGIATPLVHSNKGPHGVAAVVLAEESEQVRKAYRRINGRPSPVLVVTNFVSRVEVEEDDTRCRQELFRECSKFGAVRTVQVFIEDGDDPYGIRVFVVLEKVTTAIRAMEGLDGRQFDGRSVRVEFYDEGQYYDQVFDA